MKTKPWMTFPPFKREKKKSSLLALDCANPGLRRHLFRPKAQPVWHDPFQLPKTLQPRATAPAAAPSQRQMLILISWKQAVST